MKDGLVTADGGAALLAVSPRRFSELRHLAGFPGAIALGPRCTRWFAGELLEWARSQPRHAPGSEPAHLATARGDQKSEGTTAAAPHSRRGDACRQSD
jgi:hypothetical protein